MSIDTVLKTLRTYLDKTSYEVLSDLEYDHELFRNLLMSFPNWLQAVRNSNKGHRADY